MRASFAHAPAPVPAAVVKERNVRDAINAIRNCEYAGAGAIDLHLSCLEDPYRSEESIREILACTRLPVLVLNYNNDYEGCYHETDEESRIALLRAGAAAGASAVDMQAYSFNLKTKTSFQSEYATGDMLFAAKKPCEVALDPETVEKQKAFIRAMHAQGTEVLISCHTQVYLHTDEAVTLARELEKREPDVLKFVFPCATDEELAENFRTMIVLKKEITSCAVHFHCAGAKGRITRLVNPMLGAHLMFCNERFGINAHAEQLDLRTCVQLAEILRRSDSHMNC